MTSSKTSSMSCSVVVSLMVSRKPGLGVMSLMVGSMMTAASWVRCFLMVFSASSGLLYGK